MRRLALLRLSVVAGVLAISPSLLFACQCSGEHFYGKSVLEAAKLRAEGATSIFEGQLAKVEVKWDALAAKDGDIVPASVFGSSSSPKSLQTPYVEIAFQVLRRYKGIAGIVVRVRTGMGGGDCGAGYAQGLTYLVYASKLSDGELGVSMCSPGGWVGNEALQPDLRYLRKEPPTWGDLSPWVPRGEWQESRRKAEERQRKVKEWQERYEGATGKICGKIDGRKMSGSISGSIYFLPTLGYSYMDPPMAQIGEDGSFCSRQLGPGNYYLYFQGGSDDKHLSDVYYPSSPDQAGATPIKVTAGKTQSDLELIAQDKGTYSVRGIIRANEKPPVGGLEEISIVLVPLDGGPLARFRSQTVSFKALSFANAGYFHLDDVLPGHYAVFATTYTDGWFTKRVDLTVSSHSKFIFVDLIHKKVSTSDLHSFTNNSHDDLCCTRNILMLY